MKKIVSVLTAGVITVSNVMLTDIKVSAEKSDVTAVGEAYLKVIQQNGEYAMSKLTHSVYNGGSEYVNKWFLIDSSDKSAAQLSYTLCDIAGDGVPELFLVLPNGSFNNGYYSYGFYGFENGKLKCVDDYIVPRKRYYITESNMVKNEGSSGGMNSETSYYSLAADSATLKQEIAYVIDEDRYLLRQNGTEKEISEDEYVQGLRECEEQYKKKTLDLYSIYDPTGIYEFMAQAVGKGVPGDDITDVVSDSELMQIQDCIKLLNGFYMKDEADVCDISSLTEFDMANLMAFVGEYFDSFVGEKVDAGEPPSDWIGPWYKYLRLSDMYEAAYKYFGVDITGVFEQLSLYEPPSDSKVGWRTHGDVKTVNGVECIEIPEQVDAAPAITPYIERIYSLSDDCSYVLYKYYGNHYTDSEPCTKPLKKLTLKSDDMRYGYAIVRNRVENGEKHYYIEQCGLGAKLFLTVSELSEYIVTNREKSNIEIDYSKINDCTDVQYYIDYLSEVIGDVRPNDSAKYDIAKYIEYVIENCCAVELKAVLGKVTVDRSCIEDAIVKADEIRVMFEKLLSDKNIALNKNIKVVIRINCLKGKVKKGVTVIYDETLRDVCDGFDGIRVVLDNNCHGVYATYAQIEELADNNVNSVYVKHRSNEYQIRYIGIDKKNIEKIDTPLTFTFKADDPLDTVYFRKNDSTALNWGGQIDDLNGTIEINTGISGDYYTEKNQPDISDISSLSDEEREAVEFIVSRGFMELSDGNFRPYMSLSRYDFTRAIVSLFYELNLDAECIFPDVDMNNMYYSYVASAQEKNTVVGYEDGTFRGNNHTTREEVISIAARTLADKKGYFYPENTDEYIRFADKELIQGWENQYEEIALAVREGLIVSGGVLAPQMNITRVDAAVILYRLFNLLYDTSPIKTSPSDGGNIEFPIMPTVVGCVSAISVGVIAFIFIRKIRIKG